MNMRHRVDSIWFPRSQERAEKSLVFVVFSWCMEPYGTEYSNIRSKAKRIPITSMDFEITGGGLAAHSRFSRFWQVFENFDFQ